MTGRTNKGNETAKQIRLAILRIEKGRPKLVTKARKLSVSAVAEECGISRSAIHKDYPEFIDQINALRGKTTRSQRDDKNRDLKNERVKNRKLRDELKEVVKENQTLASINASLTIELKQLRAIINNDNITAFRRKD